LNINSLIKKEALNKFHFNIENEYIKSRIYKIEQIDISKTDEIKELLENQKYNNMFREIIKLTENEINYFSDDELINKINMIAT